MKFNLIKVNLHLFNNTNVTTDSGLTNEMKTYYETQLIRTAEAALVHDQFAQKKPIPKNGGKTIEFRRYSSLPKALTPLTEGVTPDGQKLNISNLSATVEQYGGYVELSDVLITTAIDNNVMEATSLIADQAARTLDTITREVLAATTNRQYGEGAKTATSQLVGGADSGNDYLTVAAVRRAVRALKKFNAKKIDGYYIGIVHPDTAHDLMSDPAWKAPHEYQDTANIYNGELGAIAGVRFVESTEAKMLHGAGASGRDVYITLIFGANAYGVTEIEGGGLQHIVKQLGSAGSADPLDQRGTAGWKATRASKRLVEEYMVRIESCSTFNDIGAN